MVSEIFWDWFHHCFIPEVERYLQGKNLAFWVLLILGNAPVHCHDELENVHPNVEVLFMPQYCSSHPAPQGIIQTSKAHYMRELYCKACEALDANKEARIIDYWKSLTILSVVDYVGTAWDSIKQATVNNCWENIWPDRENFSRLWKCFRKYRKQCKKNNVYCTANKWRRFQQHEGRCGGKFVREGSRSHKLKPGRDDKTWQQSQWQKSP